LSGGVDGTKVAIGRRCPPAVAELHRGRNISRGRFLGLDIIDWSLLVGGVALVLLLALFV